MAKTVAIIPARGGSKRVPRKNLRTVGGKPLIAHSIEHAASAERVNRTIVSTDDEEIASTARDYGADVPFLRPMDLATDQASTESAVTHALNWLRDAGKTFDFVCLVQPTSPLRKPTDIDGALYRLEAEEAQSVVSVSKYITPPQWAVVEGKDGRLSEYFGFGSLWNEDTKRTQDLNDLRHPNGAVFAASIDAWREHEEFYTPDTVGYDMPPERSFDVDEPWELELIRNLV
jgi:CMP-N-acetylneuraminic acid synthetase